MNTPQSQIKVNIPFALKEYLESKANKFGMPIAGYIKHLILKDVEDMNYPVFEASDRTIKSYKKAVAVKEKDKAIKITNIDQFFNDL